MLNKQVTTTTSSRQTIEASRKVQTITRTYNYTVTSDRNPTSSELFEFVQNHHDEVTSKNEPFQFKRSNPTTITTTRQIQPSSFHHQPSKSTSQPTATVPKQIQAKPDQKPSFLKRLFSSKEHFTAFQKESLRSHNESRAKHGVGQLKLSIDLCSFAQEWANKIASQDSMHHRTNNKYGENIYWVSGGSVDGTVATAAWYNEIKDYNFASGNFSSATGHFTQVVWRGSAELGIGVANSQNGGIYVVANYDPPGNYVGQYKENVPRLLR